MKSYEERQADFARQEQERTVKVGEARGRVSKNIKTTDDLNIKIDKLGKLRLKPSVDLKTGDFIKVTIEKV